MILTIYQAMQLNSAGSKNLIRSTTDPKEKRKWILAYLAKIFLTVIFCFAFVTVTTLLLGADNSIAGVVILLCLLAFRQADFGIRCSHGAGVLFLSFIVLAAGPRLANSVSPVPAFLINAVCIFALLFFGCHNIIMCNHFTFVLSYLLLYGYDVTGHTFTIRVTGLLAGGIFCAVIFYVKHRKYHYKRTVLDLFREFNIRSLRTQWQIKLAIAAPLVMMITELLNLPRAMWFGICTMSLLHPFREDLVYRSKRRALFNVVGCIAFLGLYTFLPVSMYPYIGILGGIGVGFSASYSWQTIFNTFGALSMAAGVFGLPAAIALRIFANASATIYCLIFERIFHALWTRFLSLISGSKLADEII